MRHFCDIGLHPLLDYNDLTHMLFSTSYKIMVTRVTFIGFRGVITTISVLDPPLCGNDKNNNFFVLNNKHLLIFKPCKLLVPN